MDTIKKHSRLRTWFQAAYFALTNGYARGYFKGVIFTGRSKAVCVPGLNCYSCPGALGACPIGSLQAVLNNQGYKLSLYVFGLISMFGVLFGRLVCGWLCPFGLVQDLLHKIKVPGQRKNIPAHGIIKYFRYIVLIVMVILLPALVVNEAGVGKPWFCEWICPSGTLLAGIPLVAMNTNFQEAIGFRFALKVSILLFFVIASLFFYRPFCKYLCPLGAIYGVFNPVSTYRLQIDQEKCIKCSACQRACGMDIKTFETPNSMDCIRCGDCIKTCPTSAISSTWSNTRQYLEDRFVVDTPTTSTLTDSQKKWVGFIGVMTLIIGAIGTVSGLLVDIADPFNLGYIIPEEELTGFSSLLFRVCLVGITVFLTIIGIYILRNKNNDEKLMVVRELYKWCLILFGITWLIGIISLVLNPYTLGTILNSLLASPLHFIGIPFIAIPGHHIFKSEKPKAILIIPMLLIALLLAGYNADTLQRYVRVEYLGQIIE